MDDDAEGLSHKSIWQKNGMRKDYSSEEYDEAQGRSYTYFWLRPTRINLDKIMLIYAILEINVLSKSMLPWERLSDIVTQLNLSSCDIEDWAFSEKNIYITVFYVIF
jgi:hypothetical protein